MSFFHTLRTVAFKNLNCLPLKERLLYLMYFMWLIIFGILLFVHITVMCIFDMFGPRIFINHSQTLLCLQKSMIVTVITNICLLSKILLRLSVAFLLPDFIKIILVIPKNGTNRIHIFKNKNKLNLRQREQFTSYIS